MRFAVAGILLFIVGLAGASEAQELGRGDVIPKHIADQVAKCIQNARGRAAIRCFDRAGVTEGARQLARDIMEKTEFGTPAILEQVHEAGKFDIAEVYFPTMANTNWQLALVNGGDAPFMVADLNSSRSGQRARSTRQILRRHPQAFESGRVGIVAVRHLPGGGQRFVLSDIVTDGCRACEPVAVSIQYFDFRDGYVAGFQEIGWQSITGRNSRPLKQRLRRGDVRAVQMALNSLGYYAGTIDGVAGGQTRSALASFNNDYCLPAGTGAGRHLIQAATKTGLDFKRPPCAPGSQTAARLPFGDGVYAADERLCPPVPVDVQVEYGDMAYGLVVRLNKGNWAMGESSCTIRRSASSGATWSLDLDCLAEGMPQQQRVELSRVNANGFVYRGRAFRKCQPKRAQGAPLKPGVYAEHPGQCPLSDQPVADLSQLTYVRPLVVEKEYIAWGHAACRILDQRATGRSIEYGLECSGENQRWNMQARLERLSDTEVWFQDARFRLCPPVPEPQQADTAGRVKLPMEDGIYSFLPEGCPKFDGSPRNQRQRIAASLRKEISRGYYSGGEEPCPIRSYRERNGQGELAMSCQYQDTPIVFTVRVAPKTRKSFEHNGQIYRKCE